VLVALVRKSSDLLEFNQTHNAAMFLSVPFQNRPVHIRPITTDHSKQITFVTDLLIIDPFITDHVNNGPHLKTDHVHNRPVHNRPVHNRPR